jgi:hypothetical protein
MGAGASLTEVLDVLTHAIEVQRPNVYVLSCFLTNRGSSSGQAPAEVYPQSTCGRSTG